MNYHRRFRNQHRKTLDATRRLIRGWTSVGVDGQWEKSRLWLAEVSVIYRMNQPKLKKTSWAGQGCYEALTNTIHMKYPSITTLLHEFRHAYQFSHPSRLVDDVEDDARAWSLSLYYKIAPRTVRRLASQGKILFLDDAFPVVRTGHGEQF
jgi:hypothetical protein